MKKALIALSVVATLTLLMACGEAAISPSDSTGGSDDAAPAVEYVDPVDSEPVEEPVEPEPVEEPAEEPAEPEMTMGQEQAVDTALNYLDYSAFSHKGLIDQLVYEGFSKADAKFAVDYISPDWNAQAAQMAQDYLDYSSFSRQGLIDQLVYEGFTKAQAEYGVKAVGY